MQSNTNKIKTTARKNTWLKRKATETSSYSEFSNANTRLS